MSLLNLTGKLPVKFTDIYQCPAFAKTIQGFIGPSKSKVVNQTYLPPHRHAFPAVNLMELNHMGLITELFKLVTILPFNMPKCNPYEV